MLSRFIACTHVWVGLCYFIQNKIKDMEASITDLTEKNHRFESDVSRLKDEKERYTQQNYELHAKLKELSCKSQNPEEDPTLEIVKRLSEVEATKESVIQELRSEIIAWKYKVYVQIL